MTESVLDGVGPSEPTGERAARQLAAMRLLFDVDREKQQADILLATIFEILGGAEGRTTDELLRQVEADWPGVVLSHEKLEATLELAEKRSLLRREGTLAGVATWFVSGTAAVGVDDSKAWADAVLDRCCAQIEDSAHDQDLAATPEQARLWTDILLEVLHDGIVASFAQKPGEIREVARKLFPPYDRDRIVTAAAERVDDPEVSAFLSALALSALDPGSTFGSEVVHYLATGYVLYALFLGYDLSAERHQLGALRGETLLLDTPVLLRLLSGGREFRWTSDLVGRIARQAGVVVAVAPRTRTEFTEMLERRETRAHQLETELKDGVSREKLGAVVPDEVLAIWLREPTAPSWAEFTAAADRLLTTMKAIGVQVDYTDDNYAPTTELRRRFAEQVQAVSETRGKRRHDVPAEHDGEILCLINHLRTRSGNGGGGDDSRIWPGAFVVTTDRSLDDAYRNVADSDTPVALTLSQTASLLARLAQPDDAEKLAELIASDLQWQARFARATEFGIDQAIELARSFTSKDSESVMVEATSAELTFEGLLQEVDYDGDPTHAVRKAILQREERRRSVARVHVTAADEERERARRRAARVEGERDAYSRAAAERTAELSQSNRTHEAEKAALRRSRSMAVRSLIVIAAYSAAVVIGLLAVALSWLSFSQLILPLAGMVAAAKWLYDWVRDPQQSIVAVVISIASWVGLGMLGAAIF